MRYPTLPENDLSREMTDTFYGYNHQFKIKDGELYDSGNLTTEYFPMLASRPKRSTAKTLARAQGLLSKEALAYIDNGTLYYNGLPTAVTGLTAEVKQMVSMGAYIVIFPDKVYYNTEDGTDYGSLDAAYSYTGEVTYQMCASDGSVYSNISSGDVEPENPTSGQVWIDTGTQQAKQWSTATASWEIMPTVYTRMTFTTQGQVGSLFKEYDGVTVSGSSFDDINGSKLLYAAGGEAESLDDYIVVVGILQASSTQTETISIKREAPAMDYVVECQNRLWGCFYGRSGGKNLNEIYCCALGDFKNWSQYQGLSTDSYAASVGTDGEWTGAVNYMGSPVFFKENRIHQVSVSPTGAHQISDIPCRGVQKGSANSAVVVNETLYYKSRSDFCAWQGGFPVSISEALGDERYYEASAGAFGQRYYVSMRDTANRWHLFCYDLAKKLWMREDSTHAVQFAAVGDELYALVGNDIISLNGTDGTPETDVVWYAETGIMYYEYPDKKYVSRYNIRLNMEDRAEARLFVEYDSSGVWELSGTIKRHGTGTVTLPIRPRRCDHLRVRIEGRGGVKIFSIARLLEKGSDM